MFNGNKTKSQNVNTTGPIAAVAMGLTSMKPNPVMIHHVENGFIIEQGPCTYVVKTWGELTDKVQTLLQV